MDIILASNSPRRRELLEQVGITGFQVISPDVDERVEPGLSPAGMVEELSLRKARAAADKTGPDGLIIAADTVVALDGAVLGKPRDEADAFAMLSALSGREHRVYTGVSVLRGDRAVTEHEETAVAFRALTPEEIRDWQRILEDNFPGIPACHGGLALSIGCHTGPGAFGVGLVRRVELSRQ